MDADFLPPTQLLQDDPPGRVVLPNCREYDASILFNWNSSGNKPFKLFKRSTFGPNDVRDEWFRFQMKAGSRMKRLKRVQSFPPHTMSMFAKVENSKFFIFFFIHFGDFLSF